MDNVLYALKKVLLDRADQETISSYVNEINLLERLAGNDRIIRLLDSESNAKKKTLTLVGVLESPTYTLLLIEL